MHTTDSIDYDVVLEGEIVPALDDGQEVMLCADAQPEPEPSL